METENNVEQNIIKEEKKEENKLSVPMAIIIAGALIAGAVYFSSIQQPKNTENNAKAATVTGATEKDNTLGNPKAKITLVMYEDFQCPFCGAITGTNEEAANYLKQKVDPKWTPFMPEILNTYVKNGDVLFVYRDYPFLGQESVQAAIAARCAGDQGKFWQYHDYLFSHQNGENKGNFSDTNLKSFAKELALDAATFDKCLGGGKYAQSVADSKTEGDSIGVSGTPKGFILKNGKVVSTIDGAESLQTVKAKIDAALK